MTYGICSAVDQMKRPPFESTLDSPPPNAEREQLMAPDDAMLCLRQFGKQTIYMALALSQPTNFTFTPCEGVNVKLVRREGAQGGLWGHGPDAGAVRRTRGARNVKSLPKNLSPPPDVRADLSSHGQKRGSNPPLPPLALIP